MLANVVDKEWNDVAIWNKLWFTENYNSWYIVQCAFIFTLLENHTNCVHSILTRPDYVIVFAVTNDNICFDDQLSMWAYQVCGFGNVKNVLDHCQMESIIFHKTWQLIQNIINLSRKLSFHIIDLWQPVAFSLTDNLLRMNWARSDFFKVFCFFIDRRRSQFADSYQKLSISELFSILCQSMVIFIFFLVPRRPSVER